MISSSNSAEFSDVGHNSDSHDVCANAQQTMQISFIPVQPSAPVTQLPKVQPMGQAIPLDLVSATYAWSLIPWAHAPTYRRNLTR